MNNLSRSRRRYLLAFIVALPIAAAIGLPILPSRTNAGEGSGNTSVLSAYLVPVLTASKTAALDTTAGGDLDGNGVINPGDRLTYSVTIQNAGANPATGVNFSDTIDANTTLVPGSLIVSPIAVNDGYAAIGNVGITVPAASGLFANDLNPHGSGSFVITAVNTAGTQGTVAVNNADGSFTFNPNSGFEGSTTFAYTLSNGTGLTDNATVTITVTGMLWFVNNNSPACSTLAAGCGRLSNPFSTLAEFQALNNGAGNNPAAGDKIFIYRQAATDYAGPVTLLNNQILVGQGATSTFASVAGINLAGFPFANALPATGGTNPNITTTLAGTNALNIASGNTLRGLTVGNTTGAKLNATANVGTLTIGPASGASDVTLTGNGQAINLTGGGTLAARFASISTTNSAAGTTGITLTNFGGSFVSPTTTITNPAGIGLSVSGSTAGASFNFGNTTANQSGGTGVSLSGNAGAITFADVDIAPDANVRALQATNSTGVLTVTSGTFSTSGAVATEITNATGTFPLNVQLTSVSANGGTNGVVLTNTSSSGSPGGFRVLASGGSCTIATPTCTGGVIQNTTGSAISLSNTSNVVFTRLRAALSGFHGINVTGATGLTLLSSYLERNGNGDDENSLNILNASGSVLIDAAQFNGAAENLVRVDNNNANLTFTVQNGSLFEFPNPKGSAFANSGILITPKGSSVINASVQGNTFRNIPVSSYQIGPDLSSTGTSTTVFSSNNLSADVGLNVTCASNPECRVGNVVVGGTGGITQFVAASNVFNRVNGDGVFIMGANQASTLRAEVSNNSISNAIDDAFVIGLGQNARAILKFNANTINTIGGDAFEVASGETNPAFGTGSLSDMDLVITNNTMTNVGQNASLGFVGGVGVFRFGDTDQELCLALTGNSVTNNPIGLDVYLDGNFGALGGSIRYEGTGTGAVTSARVKTDNPGVTLANIVVSATNLSNGVTCQRPSIVVPFALVPSDPQFQAEPAVRAMHRPSSAAEEVIDYRTLETRPESVAGLRADLEAVGSLARELFAVIGSRLQPMATAAEISTSASGASSAASSGETINKPLGTIPAGESVVVQFKVTIDANIPSNDFAVSNTAQITAANHAPINSTTATAAVVQPPTISKAFGVSNIGLNSPTSLTFTIGNANPATAFTNVAFTDNLPAGLVIATPNGLASNCGGGTISAVAGASTFSVSALSRAANSSCTIVINVVGTTDGAKNNTTTAISSTQGGTGLTSNTAVLNVYSLPSFAKAFGAASIPLNSSTSLTFTFTNNSATLPLSGISFIDNLPAGMSVATVPNITGSCASGTITADAGATSVSLTGAVLAGGSSCSFSVDVAGTTAGNKVNSATLATNELGSGATAMASLNVVAPPTIAKGFSPNTILLNETSTLTISMTNPAGNQVSLADVGVVDSLPVGMEVDATPSTTNSCSTGSFAPVAAATSISISGATIPVGTTCNFAVRVRATDTGAKVNTTGNVQSGNGGQGGTATATLNVGNTLTWTGATSSDWNTPTNWSPAVVPAPANSVLIPTLGVTNEPTVIVAGPDVTVSGLTVESGRILTVASGRTLTVNGAVTDGGTINVAGNLAATSVASGGSVNFTGTLAQSIPAGSYNNVTVNNAAGVALTANIDVGGILALQNGIIGAGDFTLTFSPTGSATRAGTCTLASCFVANNPNAGGARKQFNAGATAAFVYPVGTSGGTDDGYSPVELANVTAASAGDSLAVRAVDAVSPAPIGSEKITRYWELTEAGGITTDITFRYLDGDDDAVTMPAALGILRGGTPVCSSLCVDEADRSATIAGVSEFSPWTMAVLVATAADVTVGGRVVTDRGKGIKNARLTLTDASGQARHAHTSSFGYYRFADVPAGATYILSVSAKRYTFAEPTMVLNVVDDLTGVDFVGER